MNAAAAPQKKEQIKRPEKGVCRNEYGDFMLLVKERIEGFQNRSPRPRHRPCRPSARLAAYSAPRHSTMTGLAGQSR